MEQVIAALMSEDNNVRTQAESMFNQAKSQPNEMVIAVMQVIGTSSAKEVRGF
jgi:hypothetical protein